MDVLQHTLHERQPHIICYILDPRITTQAYQSSVNGSTRVGICGHILDMIRDDHEAWKNMGVQPQYLSMNLATIHSLLLVATIWMGCGMYGNGASRKDQ